MAEFEITDSVDITDVVCPVTFVKAKVALEELDDGDILSIRLNDGEPVQNVPRSIKEEGHQVLKLEENGDGTYTIETPRGNNAHLITLYLTPDEGAVSVKTRYTFRLFKTGEQTLRQLAVDGVAVPNDVRNAINTGDAFTATLSGNVYTVLPEVTATVIDGSTPEITSELKDGVATYTIKATELVVT